MLLSGSTNTFGTSGCSKQFKFIRHFLSTEGWPAQQNQPYDCTWVLHLGVAEVFPPLFWLQIAQLLVLLIFLGVPT